MDVVGNLRFISLGDGELQNAVIERLASDPTAVEGRLYYNTTDNVYRFYNGSTWNPVGDPTAVQAVADELDKTQISMGYVNADGTFDPAPLNALGNVSGLVGGSPATDNLVSALQQLDSAISVAAGGGFSSAGDGLQVGSPNNVIEVDSTVSRYVNLGVGLVEGNGSPIVGSPSGPNDATQISVGYPTGRVDVVNNWEQGQIFEGLQRTYGVLIDYHPGGGGGSPQSTNGFRFTSSGDFTIIRPRTADGLSWDTSSDVLYNKATGIWTWEKPLEVQQVRGAVNGSAGAPIYTFDLDDDTGIYKSSANRLNFSVGGREALRIDESRQLRVHQGSPDYISLVTADYVIPNKAYVDAEIAAATPALELDDLTDATVTNPQPDEFLVGVGSPVIWRNRTPFQSRTAMAALGTAGGTMTGNLTMSGSPYARIFLNPGTESVPGIAFQGDINCGLSAEVADTMVFSTQGSGKFVIYPDGTLKVTGSPSDYDTLVLEPNDIPNKKYVDDAITAATPSLAFNDLSNVTDTTNAADQFVVTDGATSWVTQDAAGQRTSLGLDAGGAGDIWVEKAGDTMTGDLSFGNTNIVTNLIAPTNAGDAANKQYVDSIAAGLDPKASSRCATTADLGYTYSHVAGSPEDGVGDTLTNPSFGAVTIDGVALDTVGQRVLVKDQTNADENGIYEVTTVGVGSPQTALVLTRATDFDGSPDNEVSEGAFTFVEQGTTQAATGWLVVGTSGAGDGSIKVGVDDIDWTQATGAGTIVAGTGLSQSGNTFNVNMGAGIVELPSDEVGIDLLNPATSALYLTDGGSPTRTTTNSSQLGLLLDGPALTQGAAGLLVADTTVAGDSGSFTVIPSQTMTIAGGTSITTAATGSPQVLTITNDAPNVDQNIWLNIAGDSGSTAANTTTDTLTIAGGVGIQTAMVGDVLTVTNIAGGSPTGAPTLSFSTINGDSGAVTALVANDTMSMLGGTLTTTTATGSPKVITIDVALNLDDVSDVTAPTPSENDIISFIGSPLGWVSTTNTGGTGASVQLAWRFDDSNNLETDPGSQRFKYDNATPASVTEIYVNDIARSGVDASTVLSALEVGDILYIQQKDEATAYLLATVTAVTDNIGWWTIGVTVDDSGLLPGNNRECGWVLNFAANQSPQNVFTTISGDSGTVTANSTSTNITFVGGTGITTVATASPQVLTINADSVTSSLNDLSDVTTTSPAIAEVLAVAPTGSPAAVGSPATFVNVPIYAESGLRATSTTHIWAHNLNQRWVNVTVLDSSNEVVIPNSITMTDEDTVTVTFGSSIECRIIAMGVPTVVAQD